MKKLSNVLLAFLMLGITLLSAGDVAAVKLFGYHVGLDGVRKEPQQNQVQTVEPVQAQVQARETAEGQEETVDAEEKLIDAGEVLEYANSDRFTTDFLKNFAGDNFCIQTEQRLAYANVNDDGTISLLNEKPLKCAEIKAQERYLSQIWEKVQNRERVSYKEIKENFDIPWKVKMKVAYTGFKMGAKESFS